MESTFILNRIHKPAMRRAGKAVLVLLALLLITDLGFSQRRGVMSITSFVTDNTEPVRPPQPRVFAVPGDGKVTIYWDESAESHYDPFFETIFNPITRTMGRNPRNFEGYMVYKSTDPGFIDALRITDNLGNPQRLSPVVRYDLANQIVDYHPASIDGVRYWLGQDTGISRIFEDTDVINGRTYYYAVVAYTHGDALSGFEVPIEFSQGVPLPDSLQPLQRDIYTWPPLESEIDITVGDDGTVQTGVNTVSVMPRGPVSGFMAPEDPEIAQEGSAGGLVDVTIIDPSKLNGGSDYEVTFEDTVIRGATDLDPDLIVTKNFSLTNLSTGEVLIDREENFQDRELPVREGFLLSLENTVDSGFVNLDLTRWEAAGPDRIHPFDIGVNTRFAKLNDYRIEFEEGVASRSDTVTLRVGGLSIFLQDEDVNFRVINSTENRDISFAFFTNPGIPRDLRSVYMFDDTRGVAVGGGGVIRQTDDGENWEVRQSGVTSRLYSVHFADENNGWAVGANGVILSTTDGGTNWGQQQNSTTVTLNSVRFIDNQTGVAVGENGTIIRTTDGGENWEDIESGSIRNLFSVYFINENSGWAVGQVGEILVTNDGGLTWSKQVSGSLRILQSVFFLDENTGWIVGNNNTILRTTDGGTTWLPVTGVPGSGIIYSVQFADAGNGWAVGAGGRIIRSTDGGATWEQQNSTINVSIYDIDVRTDASALAVGEGPTILITDNSGTEWSIIPTPKRFRAIIDELGRLQSDEIYFIEDFSATSQNVITWKVGMLPDPRGGTFDPGAGDQLFIFTNKPFTSGDRYTFSIREVNLPRVDQETASANLGEIRVVPNPYLVTHVGETAFSGRQLHFTNLPAQCTIRIFNVAGRLLQTIDVNNSYDNDRYIWDMRTKEGDEISYGIYIYHVDAAGAGSTTGKFAVMK
ncbi:MAG: WD40/YVTN/BNR-like repeat-containing protein [Cyclonatronaceae bacterium]